MHGHALLFPCRCTPCAGHVVFVVSTVYGYLNSDDEESFAFHATFMLGFVTTRFTHLALTTFEYFGFGVCLRARRLPFSPPHVGVFYDCYQAAETGMTWRSRG